jgi:hypothetical protein
MSKATNRGIVHFAILSIGAEARRPAAVSKASIRVESYTPQFAGPVRMLAKRDLPRPYSLDDSCNGTRPLQL